MTADDSTPSTPAPPGTSTGPPAADEKPATPDDRQEPKQGIPPEVERALRKANKEAETYRLKLKEIEDRDKSEMEKLTDQLKAAQDSGIAAMRLDVALEKAPEGLPPAKIRSLAKRLSGSTREELEADAVELFAEFAGQPGEEQQNGKNVRPQPNLRRQVPVPKGDAQQDAAAGMNDWLRRSAGH